MYFRPMSATRKWTHEVPENTPRMRIDDYCGGAIPILGSKSATKKAIKKSRITLNGKKAETADFIHPGDIIVVEGTGIRAVKKLDVDLPVIYEDDYMIIVNKPGGLAVNGNRYKTVENALAGHHSSGKVNDPLPRPVAVHRIDVPTNGLVVLAKTKSALIELARSFQEREIRKTYLAVVHGHPPKSGTIDNPIDGKPARTDYEVLRRVPSQKFNELSLLNLKPVTGRTHQLRKHLKSIGHLIVGDKQYAGDQPTILGKGLLLSAAGLQFLHPDHGRQVTFSIDPPAKFKRILDREENRYRN